ncbi:MAG: hypothetical protein U1E28_01895 [Beijerinckiaceae bacterium]
MRNGAFVATAIWLGASWPASAQELRREPGLPGTVSPATIAQRVDAAAERLRQQGKSIDRLVEIDSYLPANQREYDGLAGNGVTLLSALTRVGSELPLARVYLNVGGREIDLVPIAPAQRLPVTEKMTAAGFGFREDRFYLLPAVETKKEGFLFVDWSSNRSGFRVYALPLTAGGWMQTGTMGPVGKPDPDALAAVLRREYGGYKIKQ